jgi:hypothetical protein
MAKSEAGLEAMSDDHDTFGKPRGGCSLVSSACVCFGSQVGQVCLVGGGHVPWRSLGDFNYGICSGYL